MKTSDSRQQRQKGFVWVVLGCIALAVGYTSWVIRRAAVSADQAQGQGTPIQIAQPDKLAIQEHPHLLFVNMEKPDIGKVTLAGLDPASPSSAQRVKTELICERIHYAANNGICLMYDTSGTTTLVTVTLFGSDFQPRHQATTEGILSRARVSPDGKYAAFTVFVTGHSYADANMSTATVLLDMATGASLGNLEEFEVWKDGQPYEAPEFNFWGVTFSQDSNLFYSTLQHGSSTYLVQGDVSARKLTVLRENVECPSLSPDGTHIAFKKRVAHRWQLTVLDLATMQEIKLAETTSIDDQVEWLDNDRILYHKTDYDPPKLVSVFVVPADGSGQPEVFMPNAISPAVVR